MDISLIRMGTQICPSYYPWLKRWVWVGYRILLPIHFYPFTHHLLLFFELSQESEEDNTQIQLINEIIEVYDNDVPEVCQWTNIKMKARKC